jgi:hypothetical protein
MSALSAAREESLGARIIQLPVSRRRRRPPLPVFGLLGWIVAALGIYSLGFFSRGALRGLTPAAIAIVKIVFIITVGAAFARMVRGSSPDLILATGLGWLTLSIAADFVAGVRSVDVAYRLLGDPTVVPHNLRNLTILIWLAAPVLFARHGERRDKRFESSRKPR